jgi:hypothetical protein
VSEKEWASFGFPPLRLTTADLQSLVETAGPKAELSALGESPVQASDLIPAKRSWVAHAVIQTPELRLEFGDDHASLNFDNRAAVLAEELVDSLCPAPRSGLSILVPLLIGAALFIPLFLIGIRTDVASLVAMAAMLIAMAVVVVLRKPTQPISTELEGDVGKWRTTFSMKGIGFDDLANLLQKIGDEVTLEFASDDDGPHVLLQASGIELTLRATGGEVVYVDASARMEPLYNKVHEYRQTLRWFTHDDLAILAGMIFPIGALVLAPSSMVEKAVLVAVVPWFAYLVWVLRNQGRKWCVIHRS